MIPQIMLGTREGDHQIWEITNQYRTVKPTDTPNPINIDVVVRLYICFLWNKVIGLVVLGRGECMRYFQIISVRKWEEKCEMAPPRGSFVKSSAIEVLALSQDKGKSVAQKGKSSTTQA